MVHLTRSDQQLILFSSQLCGGGCRGRSLPLHHGFPLDGGPHARLRPGRRLPRRHHPLPHQHRRQVRLRERAGDSIMIDLRNS